MLTILIALALGAAGWLAGAQLLDSTGWAVFLTLVGFIVPTVLLNLWNRRRLERVFQGVQESIQQDQEGLRKQLNQMQSRMGGATKGLQKQVQKKQQDGIRRALGMLDDVKPLHIWNFLAERQANTMRAQLHYQLGEFDQADEYLKKCFVMDPLTLAIKMARAYKRDDPKTVEKLFKKGKKRFKGDQGVLIWGLYSWILVRQDRIDEAVKVLAEAKEKVDNAELAANWDHLVNGRVKQFSNAGLGDQWYALQLELPKQKRVRQSRSGGKRRLR
jgi:tetratricopeptide (TPR) repeat protein